MLKEVKNSVHVRPYTDEEGRRDKGVEDDKIGT